jgi:WhiB family redox-sensing transcriptional regulator
MTRSLRTAPEAVRRVRRDPRFRAALDGRIPEAQWRSRGECLRHDPELFFPNAAEDPADALRICGECVVSGPCLAAALDAGECDGVWGATTPDERRPMRAAWPVAQRHTG